MRRRSLTALVALATILAVPTAAQGRTTATVHPKAPFLTERPAMLEARAPGVVVKPLLSSGDLIGGKIGGFQYTGTPDGIGIYRSTAGQLEVFTNHELSYRYGDPAWSRVSHLSLNHAGAVVGASYAVDGTERYEYFCSSTLDTLNGVPWYFTGEEWTASPKGGLAIGINALTGRVLKMPWFGSINHENIVPIKKMSKAAMWLSEDSFRLRSQAYAYFAGDFQKVLKGAGSFAVWVPNKRFDGDPSADDIEKGETITGRWVTIPHADRMGAKELNAVSEKLGSFNFVRIEDAATDPSNPGVVYFSDTGANKAETRYGRVYKMRFSVDHPRRSTLSVVLDSKTDDIANPDNLGIDATTLMIQEDRNNPATGYNRIHAYDLASKTLTTVARTNPTKVARKRAGGPGAWESTGIVDASRFFGAGTWLLNVQGHKVQVWQQGLSLKVDSARGQRGQLILLTVPGT